MKKLCAIKGVGIRTVATLIAETNGLRLFKNARQLVSFAGYDIIENQSGAHQGRTRISKKGNSHIRRILHLPAFLVVRWKVKPFEDLYERTYAKHGIKMKSYVAVQKKLLVMIYTLWKNDQEFDENYTNKYQKQEDSIGAPAVVGGCVATVTKQVVPTNSPALHKVNIISEQSRYVSSHVEQS